MRVGKWAVGITAVVVACVLAAPAAPSTSCRMIDPDFRVCAPIGEHGAPLRVEEDGSATYRGGWSWDPESETYEVVYWRVAHSSEVWWTTKDCPAGVQVPCLDPTVSLADLPEWARS